MHDMRGSCWRKWDFHVHTPYSVLNNGFGVSAVDGNGEEIQAVDFDGYVYELFAHAIEKDVAAIGITDYFCIDGYKRIRREYLDDDAVLTRVFPDETMREAVKRIFVFPNVEFRTDDYLGKTDQALNYHVIFSDQVPIENIEQLFLRELHFLLGNGELRPLSRDSIVDFGKAIAPFKRGDREDYYRLGMENLVIKRSEIRDTLIHCSEFEGRYIITAAVDAAFTKNTWNNRVYPTRREVYSECDCYLTSSQSTRNWAIAVGEEEERKREVGSIKPCIWGSDAHSYERLFEPDEQRYCWVKADTTFEGMKQLLLEPADRVHIQRERPDEGDAHKIIDSIRVHSLLWNGASVSVFQEKPVLLNPGLTCIIGGKSTGKSLLLRTIAHAINPSYAREQEQACKMPMYPHGLKAEVTWLDGTTEPRKIIYIPQTYLNRLSDDPQSRTETDSIVEGVLLKEMACRDANDQMKRKLSTLEGEVHTDLALYMELKKRRRQLMALINAEGSSEVFESTVVKLEEERNKVAANSQITEDEIAQYEKLCQTILAMREEARGLTEDISALGAIRKLLVVVPGHFQIINNETIHQFSELTQATEECVRKTLAEEQNAVNEKWALFQEEVSRELIEKVNRIRDGVSLLEKEREPLKEKVDSNARLSSLASQIEREREKLETARMREAQVRQIDSDLEAKREELLGMQEKILAAINGYCSRITETMIKETKLEFEARPVWRERDFRSALLSQVDNRSLSQFRAVYGVDIREIEETDYKKAFLSDLWQALESPQAAGGLPMKSGFTLDQVIGSVLSNWYNVHYVVKSDGDPIDSMSPGKKGLVLLELIIDLDNENCPLLIDQPEDDLDNRSVYNELVSYLRRRKSDRQIVVVTHNANVVLGTDAEEVIIANQHGADTPNEKYRFEYRSGSIENNECITTGDKGILWERGMQDQMCDILEGGPEALKRRMMKYTSPSFRIR